MGKKLGLRQSETMNLNIMTQTALEMRCRNIALSSFRWKNLPPTVDPRYLEMMLLDNTFCIYFNDPIMGDLALGGAIGSGLDVYGTPYNRTPIGANGYRASRTRENSVIIYDNYTRTSSNLILKNFVQRMYHVQRAIDVNIRQQKTPRLIAVDQNTERKIIEALRQVDENSLAIITDPNTKELFKNEMKDNIYDISSPYIADKLEIEKHNIWNEFLTWRGVENANADKKERLVSDEVGSNSGNVEAERNSMLYARLDACDQINRIFGTNITVEFNSNLSTNVNTSLETFLPTPMQESTEVNNE